MRVSFMSFVETYIYIRKYICTTYTKINLNSYKIEKNIHGYIKEVQQTENTHLQNTTVSTYQILSQK